MDRVKKMVHYWCDDIKKQAYRKRGDGCGSGYRTCAASGF